MEAALASSETTGVPVSAVVALDATALAADIAAGITQDSTGAGLALELEADINATAVDNVGLAQKVLSLETTEVADVTTDAEDAVVQVDEKLAAADQTAAGAADAVAGGTDGSAGLGLPSSRYNVLSDVSTPSQSDADLCAVRVAGGARTVAI